MAYLPSIVLLVRRFLLFQLALILSTIDFQEYTNTPHNAATKSFLFTNALNTKQKRGGSGFNYEIEKRVHERVSELMSIPVTMLGLVEQYSKTDVFEVPFLRPHQRDDIFRFMWTVWKEFGIDLYYGQEGLY